MTKKMMGVIYKAFKEGKLTKTTNDDISRAYFFINMLENELLENELKAYHHEAYECTMSLRNAVKAIFNGDYETADNMIFGFSTVEF